jgi:hypothetical protein
LSANLTEVELRIKGLAIPFGGDPLVIARVDGMELREIWLSTSFDAWFSEHSGSTTVPVDVDHNGLQVGEVRLSRTLTGLSFEGRIEFPELHDMIRDRAVRHVSLAFTTDAVDFHRGGSDYDLCVRDAVTPKWLSLCVDREPANRRTRVRVVG